MLLNSKTIVVSKKFTANSYRCCSLKQLCPAKITTVTDVHVSLSSFSSYSFFSSASLFSSSSRFLSSSLMSLSLFLARSLARFLARSLSLFHLISLSFFLSCVNSLSLLNVNDIDHLFSRLSLSVLTALTYPVCQSAWALALERMYLRC